MVTNPDTVGIFECREEQSSFTEDMVNLTELSSIRPPISMMDNNTNKQSEMTKFSYEQD